MESTKHTHIEVNLNAIQDNAKKIKKFTGRKLIAVVKADAYGHGVVRVAEALHTVADMFAVANVEEGIELRHAGIRNPILILFSPLTDYTEQIVTYQLTSAIDNWELAHGLNNVYDHVKLLWQPVSKIKVHVDINTGMNRSGISYKDTSKFLKKLNTLKRLEIEGIYTHLATADEADKSFSLLQLERFSNIFDVIPIDTLKHAANSAAALSILESHYDAIRPGLSLYGIYPGKEKPIQLEPALTWRTYVGWIETIAEGDGVSYGITYKASETTQIAGLQVGYGDGYPRSLSGIGEVLIGGKRKKIIGRICMDNMVVLLESSDNISVGSEVVLIGKQGEEEIRIEEVAERAGTIPYEILTRISNRVFRIYTKE